MPDPTKILGGRLKELIEGSEDVGTIVGNNFVKKVLPYTDDALLASGILKPGALPDSDNVKNVKEAKNRVKNRLERMGLDEPPLRNTDGGSHPYSPHSDQVVIDHDGKGTKTIAEPAAEAAAGSSVLRKLESVAGTASTIGGIAPIAADFALPAVGAGLGLIGLTGAKATLNKPKSFLGQTIGKTTLTRGNALMDGSFAVVGALQEVDVVRSFFGKLASLKMMYADLTGMSVDKVSTATLLTGDVPPLVADARKHLLMEHVSRGLINAFGVGLIINSLRKGKATSMLANMGPMAASAGLDFLMGESALMQVYSGFRKEYDNALAHGQAIPPEVYAQFLIVASPDIKMRGKVGQEVALEIAKQYTETKTSPGDILKEIQAGPKGKFMERVHGVLTNAEFARKHPHKDPHPAQHAHAEAPAHGKMVARLNGQAPERKPVGDFTNRLKAQEHDTGPAINLN